MQMISARSIIMVLAAYWVGGPVTNAATLTPVESKICEKLLPYDLSVARRHLIGSLGGIYETGILSPKAMAAIQAIKGPRGEKEAQIIAQELDRNTPEEIILIYQILESPTESSLFSGIFLQRKIKAILESHASGSQARLNSLQELLRTVRERLPGIALATHNLKPGQKLFLFNEDGFLEPHTFLKYDPQSAVASIKRGQSEIQISAGDLFGKMPEPEAIELGYSIPDIWEYGKTSDYVRQVKWQLVGQKDLPTGKTIQVRSDDERDRNDMRTDPRWQAQNYKVLQLAGFHFDPASGILTIPDVEAAEKNLKLNAPYLKIRLQKLLSREETPLLTFLRLLSYDIQPIGVGKWGELITLTICSNALPLHRLPCGLS